MPSSQLCGCVDHVNSLVMWTQRTHSNSPLDVVHNPLLCLSDIGVVVVLSLHCQVPDLIVVDDQAYHRRVVGVIVGGGDGSGCF